MLADVQVPAQLEGEVSRLGCACGQPLPGAVPQLSPRAVTESCIAGSPLCPGGGDKAGGCPDVPINTETAELRDSCSLRAQGHTNQPREHGDRAGEGDSHSWRARLGITRNVSDPCWHKNWAEVLSQVFLRGEGQGLEELSASLPLPLIPECHRHNHSRGER